jgi:histidinol phosphatase-like enzyme (inositol monophosphatase family)
MNGPEPSRRFSPEEPLGSLVEFALEVAAQAGDITLRYFQKELEVERKPDSSPVTRADREAERIIRERIEKSFPGDGILGEELGETRREAERRWVVDPIDGTRSFVCGVPFYGVLIALEIAGDPVLGVMHFPALEESVYAARDLGCWWNGSRVRVSAEDRMERATILATDIRKAERSAIRDGWHRLVERAGMVRTWGDCYGHALVATGRAEAMIDFNLKPWDAIPMLPILTEAGGTFTDWDGKPNSTGGDAIATNYVLASEVLSLLSKTD